MREKYLTRSHPRALAFPETGIFRQVLATPSTYQDHSAEVSASLSIEADAGQRGVLREQLAAIRLLADWTRVPAER